MFNFLVAFFLKISQTLKAHISGTETDINKRQKAFFLVFNRLSYQPIKKLSKISMHMHFKATKYRVSGDVSFKMQASNSGL